MKTNTPSAQKCGTTPTLHRLALAALAVLCASSMIGPAGAVAVSSQPLTIAHATSLRSGDAVIGALPMQQPIHIEVALKMRDRAGLDALIANSAKALAKGSMTTPMTSAQFLASHAPTQQQAQAVVDYLTGMGFTHVTIAPNRLLVSADGTAWTAGNAFKTTFAQVRTHDGRIAFANTDAARIPAALGDKVLAVVGLQTVHQAQAVSLIADPVSTKAKILQGHYPTEFPSIYGSSGEASSSSGGLSIGVITNGNLGPVLTDLDVFITTTGREVAYSIVNTHGTSGDISNLAAWDLATQGTAGMSIWPAKLILYNVPDLSSANLTANYNRVVADNTTKIIEASISACETDAQADGTAAAQDAIFQAGIAQGQTFVFPAGDNHADECGNGSLAPSWPASSQYVIAAGGTTLNADRSTWFSEKVWSKAGGSPSTFEPMPPWQRDFGVPGTTRGVPDVAFDADPASGALIVVNRALTLMGGTGLSAALFAGAWHSVLSTHGTTSGFAGPVIYTLLDRDFHDVIGGSNGNSAHAGWDYASGRGSTILDLTVADSANFVNKPPQVDFTFAETGSLTAKFTDTSIDNDGTIVAHRWKFGDGKISSVVNPSHVYAAAGIYTVVEVVTDDDGATGRDIKTVAIGAVDVMQNPGFETGSFKGWVIASKTSGAYVINSDPQFVFAGNYSARVRADKSSLKTTFALPAYKTSAILTLHVRVDDPAHALTVKDTMEVQLNGLVLTSFTNLDASPGYLTRTYDITPYLGQGMDLRFFGKNHLTSQPTNFYLDDITVVVQ